MSYKDKAVGEYRGGAIGDQGPKPARRYPCFATGCPMPGTIFPGAGVGGTGEAPGNCAWHYGVLTTDIPKVTQVLRDWQFLTYETNEARRFLTGQAGGDPMSIRTAFTTAWERVQPQAGEWAEELRPGKIRSSDGKRVSPFDEDYGDWAKRLERFLGARVVEVLSIRQRRAA